jgi:hypothetical protein
LFECTSEVRPRKSRLRPQEIRRIDHATPLYPQKLALRFKAAMKCTGAWLSPSVGQDFAEMMQIPMPFGRPPLSLVILPTELSRLR